MGEVDGVLNDVALLLEIGRDVHRRVGHQQRARIARHIHQIHMAEPPARVQAAVRRQHGVQQLVGVQRALHQKRRLASVDGCDGLGRRCDAMGDVDQAERRDIDLGGLRRLEDLTLRPDQDRGDQARMRRFDRGAQRIGVARMSDGRRQGLVSDGRGKESAEPLMTAEPHLRQLDARATDLFVSAPAHAQFR